MSKDMTPAEYMQQQGLKKLFFVNSRQYQDSHHRSSSSSPEHKLLMAVKTSLLKSGKMLIPEVERATAENEEYFLNAVLSHAEAIGLNLHSLPDWKKPITDLAHSLITENTSGYDIWNGYRGYAIAAAEMVDHFKWEELFMKTWAVQKCNNYIRGTFRKVLKNYASNLPAAFRELVEDEIFFSKVKPCYAARGAMYSQYVESGFLTLKTARKIRSDASEDSSVAGLKSLVGNKEKYRNYDDLLLQFTDSKYDEVIILLADTLPDYLITSLMGTESYQGKRRVERRLELIESEKEAKKEASPEGQPEVSDV
jgi:hypothetical protein